MVMTDPIADLLTRIRNANHMRHETVEIPASRVKLDILEVFKKEGFILDYKVVDAGVASKIVVKLKYTNNNERVIKGLKRISKPGLRVYAKVEELPRVLNGLGVAVISTSNGVMTDKEARVAKVGGEVLAYIW
ncbi:MAG TPA: 30S ribosomal protein S8 [Acholeplasma sp.]|nr:30S ribosomal protein S8 [Acholeplasma sp.]